MLPFGAGNHPQCRESTPTYIFPDPRSNSMASSGEASDHQAAANKLQYSDVGQRTSPGRDDRQPVLPSPRPPTFLRTVSDDRHDGETQSAETDETHGAYSFYDALPSPRWRLVIMLGVLSLTGLGVVSAFPYRAVFGGWAVLPTLPPLVSADSGPKEIVSNYGDARPSSQTSVVSAGATEKFVSRWPADNQEPPETVLIESLNADRDMGDNIDAKMRGHRPLQPVASVQCAKYKASNPV
jgi:hypothetical protein